MSKLDALAILLISAVPAFAQTATPNIVRWEMNAPNSDRLVRNGLEIVMVYQHGLTVKAALTIRQPRQVALVEVTNESDKRVELVPANMSLELVDPGQKSFLFEDPDKLADSVRRTSPWAYVFVAMASMGTQTSHTTGMVGNVPVNLNTTTHDDAKQDRAIEAVRRSQERKNLMASDIEQGALRENTLLPGEDVAGAVFFAPPKHYDKDYQQGALAVVLRVPVGDCIFEFPFWWKGIPIPSKNGETLDHPFEFPHWWKAKK